MAKTIKTLTLTFAEGVGTPMNVECQLDTAELVDTGTVEETVTFCGTDQSANAKYQLNIGGFQDYGALEAVCDLLHAAYVALRDDPLTAGSGEIDFVLTVGGKTRSGTAKPINDIPFGGAAGSSLKFTTSLAVPGTPVDGDTP